MKFLKITLCKPTDCSDDWGQKMWTFYNDVYKTDEMSNMAWWRWSNKTVYLEHSCSTSRLADMHCRHHTSLYDATQCRVRAQTPRWFLFIGRHLVRLNSVCSTCASGRSWVLHWCLHGWPIVCRHRSGGCCSGYQGSGCRCSLSWGSCFCYRQKFCIR